MLLADIKAVFAEQKTDRLSSERLATLLSEREGRPWADCKRGDPMDKHGLARRLKLFGIQPEPEAIHFSDRSRARGYLLSAFGDAFARYLPV
jgi:hypothetical protein